MKWSYEERNYWKAYANKEALASNPNSKDALLAVASMIEERENQKSTLLEHFTIGYLEEMLKSTTKSIARDVVSTLISNDQYGTLLSIEKRFPDKQSKLAKSDKTEDGNMRNIASSHENIKLNNEQISALQHFGESDAYKGSDMAAVGQSTSSTVKFPPAQVKKVPSIKDSSSISLKNSAKNRSVSSKSNSKVLA